MPGHFLYEESESGPRNPRVPVGLPQAGCLAAKFKLATDVAVAEIHTAVMGLKIRVEPGVPVSYPPVVRLGVKQPHYGQAILPIALTTTPT